MKDINEASTSDIVANDESNNNDVIKTEPSTTQNSGNKIVRANSEHNILKTKTRTQNQVLLYCN